MRTLSLSLSLSLVLGSLVSTSGPLLGQADDHEDATFWTAPPVEISPAGFYTDRVSYDGLTDTIQVFGNWPGETVRHRVLRIGDRSSGGGPSDWEEVAFPADEYAYLQDQAPPFGSFVDFQTRSTGPSPDLAGWIRLTLEGWVYPTYTPGVHTDDEDWVGLAGQLRLGGNGITGTAGIGIDENGQLFGLVVTNDNVETLVTGPVLPLDTWSYVALNKSKDRVRLFHATAGSCLQLVGESTELDPNVPIRADLATTFRLGARSEAPGDQTGCLDGRIDRWGVWESALGKKRLQKRMNQGESSAGCSTVLSPDLDKLRLMMHFGDAGDGMYEASEPLPVFENWSGASPPVGSTWRGQVVNWGRPGVSGRPVDGRGLGLRHDQVIGARFDERTDVTIDVSGWPSGLYAIQAVFKDHVCQPPPAGCVEFDTASAENLKPEHWRCFVVRPDPMQSSSDIAVVVPTLTFEAYNAWPGASSLDRNALLATRSATARDLFDRKNQDDEYIPQGNNSIYGPSGDGVTQGYFTGFHRPNLWLSPLERAGYSETSGIVNDTEAPVVVPFFEWLEDPIGDEWDTLEPELKDRYDTYADYDLHTGALTPSDYALLMFMGKPEYWTEDMVAALDAYMDGGGSLLGVCGNTVVWKCAAKPTSEGNVVFEARKGPCVKNLIVPGYYETQSWLDAGVKLGGWRFSESCEATDGMRDAFFGTRPMIAGGFCIQNRSADFGKWRIVIEDPPNVHPYLDGLVQSVGPNPGPVANGTILEVGTVVGPEADAFYMDDDPLVRNLPIPVLAAGLPYASGSVIRLAQGWDFYQPDAIGNPRPVCPVPNPPPPAPDPRFQYIDWTEEDLELQQPDICDGSRVPDCADYVEKAILDDPPGYRFNGFGNIVTYAHQGGGKVMHVASIASPRALRNDDLASNPNNDVLSNLVGRFVKDVLGIVP